MRLASLLLMLAGAVSLAAQVTDEQLRQPPRDNWLQYHGSYDGRRHSELSQINAANVATLSAKWIFHMPNASHLQSVPVVANGVMYVTQPNEIYALDARSGRPIWEYHRVPPFERGPNRGVAIYGDKVFFSTPDAHLLALDAASGNVVWDVEIADPKVGYCSPAAPMVVKGKVLAGVAFGDRGMNGFIEAFDPETGKRLWHWDAIPRPGEPGSETWPGDSAKWAGGATWIHGTFDPELNLLYWGMGNPSPDFNGDVRQGDNLYTECLVALDPDTGKLKWYFQFTPHDVMDWDAAEVPVLVDMPWDGKMRKLIATADRNGFYYVLDRATGEYLHGSQFAKLLNWASGLTPQGKPILVPGIEPTLQGTRVCPSSIGATNWMSPTFDYQTHLFYFVALDGCGFATKNTEKFRPGGFQYRATGDVLLQDDSWRVYVRALDVATGKLVWEQERFGDIGLGGGLLSTAGGVIFSAENGGELVALEPKSGKILWHFNTGQPITAQPIAYAIKGKEYVAVAAASDVVSFGLPDSDDKASAVEKIGGGFGFTEGPVWKDGALIFSDIPNSRIMKMASPDRTETYRTGTGAGNGNSMDKQGRLYTCERDPHRVVRMEKDGKLTVIASEFEGKRLNSPNDVVVRKDKQVYFSDPLSAAVKDQAQLGFNGVYHVDPKGKISLVTKMTRPNGVALSPDGRTLYVSDTQERRIIAFDLDSKGNTTNERVFISEIDGGPDGLRVASNGNLYIACRGIAIYTSAGQFVRMIEFPETPANCAFGDPDLRTLYVTARTSVYRVRIPDQGALQY